MHDIVDVMSLIMMQVIWTSVDLKAPVELMKHSLRAVTMLAQIVQCKWHPNEAARQPGHDLPHRILRRQCHTKNRTYYLHEREIKYPVPLACLAPAQAPAYSHSLPLERASLKDNCRNQASASQKEWSPPLSPSHMGTIKYPSRPCCPCPPLFLASCTTGAHPWEAWHAAARLVRW